MRCTFLFVARRYVISSGVSSCLTMAILKTCCCLKSVRSGSFAAGIYTLAFYTIIVACGTFHVNVVLDTPALLAFGYFMLVFDGMCVISSVLLLVGLCVDSKNMLLPWLITVSMTTLLDIIVILYLITDLNVVPLGPVFFVIDFVTCALNIYCILCVISQYQEYLAGRGGPDQYTREQVTPYDIGYGMTSPKHRLVLSLENGYVSNCQTSVPSNRQVPHNAGNDSKESHERLMETITHPNEIHNDMNETIGDSVIPASKSSEQASNGSASSPESYCKMNEETRALLNYNKSSSQENKDTSMIQQKNLQSFTTGLTDAILPKSTNFTSSVLRPFSATNDCYTNVGWNTKSPDVSSVAQ